MVKSIEREFKTLLTLQQFEDLINHFELNDIAPLIQSNTYYDTNQQDLLADNAALRLRNFPDYSEWTIKQKIDEIQSIELTQVMCSPLNPPLNLEYTLFDSPDIQTFISDHEIQWDQLHITYQMTTHRWSFPYRGGELCIDRTDFGDQIDYELEFEVNHITDETAWFDLLDNFGIDYVLAEKKIARAAAYQRKS